MHLVRTKKVAFLLVVLLLMTGCQQKSNEIVHFENTDIHVLGDWQVVASGLIGSVKGTIHNEGIWTYEDIEIAATVYDIHGNSIMSSSTVVPRLAPYRTHNFTIEKALGNDPSKQWERIAWDFKFKRKRMFH